MPNDESHGPTPSAAPPEEKRHPIQVVSRRTGMSQDLLRTWERRYGVVEPGRTGGGRRLYSDRDVARLRLLQRAIAGGRPIGQVAGLDDPELEALVAEDRRAELEAPAPPSESVHPASGAVAGAAAPGGTNEAAGVVDDCLAAVEALDGAALEAVLGRALVALPPTELIESVVIPLMEEIGRRWFERRLDVAQEHFASSAVQATLAKVVAATQPRSPRAPVVVVATPLGQAHELGAMVAAATAASQGWRVTYLGSELPAEDIAGAVRRTGARAVALSLIFPPDDPHLPAELRRLADLLGDGPAILVGGGSAPSYAEALEEIDAYVGREIEDLRSLLELVRLRVLDEDGGDGSGSGGPGSPGRNR